MTAVIFIAFVGLYLSIGTLANAIPLKWWRPGVDERREIGYGEQAAGTGTINRKGTTS